MLAFTDLTRGSGPSDRVFRQATAETGRWRWRCVLSVWSSTPAAKVAAEDDPPWRRPSLYYATPQSLTARQAWINKIHSRGRLGCRPRPWRGLGAAPGCPRPRLGAARAAEAERQAGRAYLLSMPRQTPHPQPPPPTNPAVHACSGSSGGHAVQVDWSTN